MHTITTTEFIIERSHEKKLIKIPINEFYRLRKPSMSLINSNSLTNNNGLCNLGNTCYMNSIIQCLFYTPLMNQFCINISSLDISEDKKEKASSKIILQEFVKLFAELKYSKNKRISPKEFYNQFILTNSSFQGGRQHDSHEFLVIILNNLHDSLCKDPNAIQKSISLRDVSNIEENQQSKNQ